MSVVTKIRQKELMHKLILAHASITNWTFEPRETTSETEYFLPRAFRGGNWGRDPISKMAMRVTTEAVKLRFPGVSNMSTDELFQLINANNSKLILLDVRELKEFKVSHLCKAHHVSPALKDVEQVLKLITETGVTPEEPLIVVCYCSLGYRSSALAQQLQDELEKPVYQEMKTKVVIYNLEGSIFKWANEGKDLQDNGGRKTVFVHPYNVIWGKLLNAELRRYEPVESPEKSCKPVTESNL